MRIPSLNTAMMAAMSTLLCGCATMHSPQAVSGIGNYQFGYTVHSPSHIAAQVFSGQNHTYISLPHGVQLQAATGNGHLYSPKKSGPYWAVPALAAHWSFATTQGIVNASATGAALQMARVDQAQQIIQATAAAHSAAPEKPAPAVTVHPTHSATAAPVLPTARTTSPTATSFNMPTAWMHHALPKFHTPHATPTKNATGSYGNRVIPGSDGRSLPLNTALHRMTPMGWHILLGHSVSPSLPVLWHKGPWTQSLQRMARDNLLVSTVDRHNQTVFISASPAMLAGIPGAVPMAATKKSEAKRLPPVSLPKPIPVNTIPQIPPITVHIHTLPVTPLLRDRAPMKPVTPVAVPVAPLFVAHHGQMLSHDVRLYLHKQHWHLAWNLQKDYPITVGYILSGSVRSVLKQLMRLYPITVTAYAENRTIVIQSGNRY